MPQTKDKERCSQGHIGKQAYTASPVPNGKVNHGGQLQITTQMPGPEGKGRMNAQLELCEILSTYITAWSSGCLKKKQNKVHMSLRPKIGLLVGSFQ